MSLLLGCVKNREPDDPSLHIETLKSRLEHPSSEDVIVVAHRACWRESAENSLSAIEACIELGADMIEIDVRRTKDGELVLLHDETVDRTTNGSGLVSEMTFTNLREFRLLSTDGGKESDVTDETIPSLKDALKTTKDRILVNLDIKADLYDQALAVADDIGVSGQIIIKMAVNADDPMLSEAQFLGRTYFMPILRECEVDRPEKICWPTLSEAVVTYGGFNPVAFEIVNQSDEYLLEGVDAVNSLDARLWVNTLGPRFAGGRSDEKSLTDPDNNWGYLVENGVNIIQTDRPRELLEYLKSRNMHVANR